MKIAVRATEEFRRVRALPRRAWTQERIDSVTAEMTSLLRTPRGTMTLRPIQAMALYEGGTYGGLLAPIRVGGGKSLISLLLAYILDAVRPVLLLPAALIEKTVREMREYAEHWRIPRNVRMVSYEMLGRVQSAKLLDQIVPDLIITDESHRLKNRKAGVTKRVAKYMNAHPETKFVAMSGTLLKSSLNDFGHLAEWALKDGCPVPRSREELDLWAEVIEDRQADFLRSVDPGVLPDLSPTNESDLPLVRARHAFRDRLLATPGVVASQDEGVSCSLIIQGVLVPGAEPVTTENFERLRSKWETPDGWPCAEAVEIWRHARELSLGFHYVWDPRAPKEWLLARSDWASFVRGVLAHSRTYDTEHHVATAIEKGDYKNAEGAKYLQAWRDIRGTFTPNTRPVWHDDTALKFCEEWSRKHVGIIWTEHTFFAKELSRRTGLSYFGRDGVDETGRPIEKADPSKCLIASIAANSTGRNLQAWSENLITSAPTGASVWEQLLGRTHRDGQRADEVHVDVIVSCVEHLNGIEKARDEAAMIEQTSGHSQKLILADVVMPSPGRGPAFWSTR